MNDPKPIHRRRATNVSLDPQLVAEAKQLGINVSQACEAGLARETRAAREAAFRKELEPTIAFWNAYHDKHGLPFADLRQL